MTSERKKQIRGRSMLGTVLFVLGIAALIASIVIGSVWVAGAGVVLFVPGAVMLYQVGKSLS